MKHHKNNQGYILLETIVAVVILGISSITIHGVIRQSILTRGQVQDYTQVRFLMEDYMTRLELRNKINPGTGSGTFDDGSGRFAYTYTIKPVAIPVKLIAMQPGIENEINQINNELKNTSQLLHIELTVNWKRGRTEFDETIETLLPKSKLFIPKPDKKVRPDEA